MELTVNNSMKQADILIVDDVEVNLEILVQMLTESGYHTRAVTSVKRAMKEIEILNPSLILLDISMPDIDGFEFCEILKSDTKTREIPIIFISAMNSSEDKIKGFKLGAVDFITKPFEIEEVTVRVNTHLKIHQMNQDMEEYNQRLRKLVNEQRYKRLFEHKTLIHTILRLLFYENEKLNQHANIVGKNVRLLSLGLQLSPIFEKEVSDEFVEVIELAAKLHDVGMFINRQSQVFRDGHMVEPKLLKEHTIKGEEILKGVLSDNNDNDYIRMAISIARSHHEHWDGTGLPDGLAGMEIPLPARICAVADAYDNLINGIGCKPYSQKEAVTMIELESGKQFDPDIIDVFVKIQKRLKV